MTDNKKEIILYSYWRSSASWRVRLALALKNIPYEYRSVHLVKDGGEQHGEEYKSLNPMEQVPTMIIDDMTLTQSLAIIDYLEETRDGPSLYPKNKKDRALTMMISEIINSGTQPLQNLTILKTMDEKKRKVWAKDVIGKGLYSCEEIMKKCSGNV
ncbi:hypothetical protein SNEBB_009573 [Seison nebaliae]|nr:hypothetical protein SNEBB_009573 [Seison nebaliae]